MIDDTRLRIFQKTVWGYYHTHGRHDLPWRLPAASGHFDPYKIMLSEIMLQQTQVSRVIPKYHEFLLSFPTITALAIAPLGDILRIWNGLGYNRRAKFLHQTACLVVDQYGGDFPQSAGELVELPGIGANTASAILAYAFNEPVAYVETNIRSVFIHHFFNDQTNIPDKQIIELVAQTLDTSSPREWYWALMDYGTYLKQVVGNPNRCSSSYAKQSRFEGSRRQLRGQIIRLLSTGPAAAAQLDSQIGDERLESVIDELLQEGLIAQRGAQLML